MSFSRQNQIKYKVRLKARKFILTKGKIVTIKGKILNISKMLSQFEHWDF
jgi:predicted oxidoreductase